MVTQSYDIGDQRRLTATVTDIDGNLADPSAIALTIREPDGNEIVKAIGDLTNPSTGVYTYDHTIAKAGRHFVRWEATAGVIAAGETEFYARRQNAGV